MAEHEYLLVEIGTEELPPMALERLGEAFADGVVAGLQDAGLTHGEARALYSPRRLAVLIAGVQTSQPAREVEKRGPAVQAAFDDDGKPTQAAQGFARSCGVEVTDLQTLETDKGRWLMHSYTEPGRDTAALLPAIVKQALDRLPIPRRMRWGDHEEEFVRPVHWVVMMLGTEVVPGTILGKQAGRRTRGHRFMGEGLLELQQPQDYVKLLEQSGRVIVDPQQRRERVRKQAEDAGEQAGGKALVHDHVLQEVSALVEWPVAVTGRFDPRFLELPREVLIATMEEHQRYFPVTDSDGALLPAFVTISNIESSNPDLVRQGNERVVHPRLSDAEFFWKQDLAVPLQDRVKQLGGVVFEKQLGSVADKASRVATLARDIAGQLRVDAATVERAAELAKADLVTEMVGEFPELQGIIGSYYARVQAEPEDVAVALREQYLPRFAGDELPASPAGQALALADRLDTLAGIFAIGKRPSGDKDPYALRRSAIGVLRIIVEGGLELDLDALLAQALAAQPVSPAEGTLAALADFMLERQRSWYQERGVRHDVFAAIAALRPARPLEFEKRLHAVQDFLERSECEALTAAHKRSGNILRKQDGAGQQEVLPGKLVEPAETELYEAIENITREVRDSVAQGDYEQALATMAGVRETIDRFFDEVMVMADDKSVRQNRLALLAQLQALFMSVADLSQLQG